jgi:hypothetical protein
VPYVTLGSRSAAGAADTTGVNPGNWTVTFDSAAINVNVPQAEVYKIVVQGAASGATFNVAVNTAIWDLAVYAVQNSWDPQQPLIIRPGDTVFFYYSSKSTDGHQPSITIWLRYEITLGQVFGIT